MKCTKLINKGWGGFESTACFGDVQEVYVQGGIATVKTSLCQTHINIIKTTRKTWKVTLVPKETCA
jgi:hypothetical protein